MPSYGSIAYTLAVRDAQRRLGSPVARSLEDAGEQIEIGPAEAELLSGSDGFFQASVSETGWPYVQFRGGPPGFVHVLGPTTIGYADLRGNRQYISVGNLSRDDRVALLFIDFAGRRRLKLYGHARVLEDDPLVDVLAATADRGRVERAVVVDVTAGAWNCPQHITQRWTAEQVAAIVEPLRTRIGELESELAGRGGGSPPRS
jgi:predicted pyridoxine 5'-phosphate oxidase superfamily flavin-nucleotide-binding protein